MINVYKVGDNLDLLSELDNESVDLIYFDPPYNTGRDFSDFKDKYPSMQSYREDFLRPRVKECKRVLRTIGNIIIHVDPTISHHVRMLLDDIFGEKKFVNEVAWVTGGNAKNKKKMNRFHDTLICYKMSNKSVFNPIYLPYDEKYKKSSSVKICEHIDKEYVTTAIHNSQPHINPRPNLRYEWNGHLKQWYVSIERMKSLHENNRLAYNKKGIPRIKRYLEEMEGIPVRDVWADISNVQAYEKLDYATQKPVKLLDRIIKMFSNERDLVLDIFAGSGTLGRSALRCGREYILFDSNPKGKDLFKESIINE
ncbi:hypothetical protein CMI37_15950 [Candidatus Pacearchaeota archaeon]|nr:hypothetical protein [Candidatus Pacearchaeota archaeon]|tara:strand:- start:2937 stop:3866 length:930 start_codon:yes stop_codon:yes gene_type:complete